MPTCQIFVFFGLTTLLTIIVQSKLVLAIIKAQASYDELSLKHMCNDSKIDAILSSTTGEYIIKDSFYYNFTKYNLPNNPKPLSEGWPGLPTTIDAAFTYKNGLTYFFKGSQYWRYNNTQMDANFPKEISADFMGVPSNLDAALYRRGNDKIYFFKGSEFWRFDLTRDQFYSPKQISSFWGLPNNLDAAFQHKNFYIYFFKGDKYYRFNDKIHSVDVLADPPYPRPIGKGWFGC